ncbi:hypothetical protein K2Q16_00590 [Patescibacteria group bacterium]|nr:hypothetical protein [Patescibacteria group bacterium]
MRKKIKLIFFLQAVVVATTLLSTNFVYAAPVTTKSNGKTELKSAYASSTDKLRITLAKQLIEGSLTLDELKKMNVKIESKDFATALGVSQKPLKMKAGLKASAFSKNFTGMGMIVEVMSDNASIYAFDTQGRFAGEVLFRQKDKSKFGILVEDIPDVSVGSLSGDPAVTVFGPRTDIVTLFISTTKPEIVNISSFGVNQSNQMEHLALPMSPRSRASITIQRSGDSFIIYAMNFDLDNNGKTDVSVSLDKGFTLKDYETIFKTIKSDKKLPAADRKLITSWKKPFIEAVSK